MALGGGKPRKEYTLTSDPLAEHKEESDPSTLANDFVIVLERLFIL